MNSFLSPIWSILILTIAITGCASPKLSVEQRSAVKKVSIGKVELPEKPTIFGESAAGAFLLGGPLGLAITNAGSDVPAEFKKALDRSQTDVATLVSADLKLQLLKNGFEVLADGDPRADAILVPKVLQYGLTGNIFASPPVRVPALWLRVDLKQAKTGEILWWHWGSVHVTKGIIDQLEARSIADYFTKDELINSQFKKASALVSQSIFLDF